MGRMFFAKTAVFRKLKLVRRGPFVLCRCIISSFAFRTCKGNNYSHLPTPLPYSIISLTTPAPTVLPPSRMANRSPSSMAMGVISSPVIVTLSPGMIISTPSGRFNIPVTSVVLK